MDAGGSGGGVSGRGDFGAPPGGSPATRDVGVGWAACVEYRTPPAPRPANAARHTNTTTDRSLFSIMTLSTPSERMTTFADSKPALAIPAFATGATRRVEATVDAGTSADAWSASTATRP